MLSRESCLALVAVISLHAGILALALWGPSSKSQEIALPTITGIIIPAPPAETVQMPSAANIPPPVEPPPEPEEPKPVPEPKPKPEPQPKKVVEKPKPTPLPEPVVEAPPSEKAISQEEAVEQEEEAAPPQPQPPPQQASTPSAEENKSAGAPVTPPREDANLVNNPRPAYPSMSRRLREQGTVVLEVLILADGSVGDVKINQSSGFKRLDDTAVKAVRKWRYAPARRGDEAIDYWYLQPLEFALN